MSTISSNPTRTFELTTSEPEGVLLPPEKWPAVTSTDYVQYIRLPERGRGKWPALATDTEVDWPKRDDPEHSKDLMASIAGNEVRINLCFCEQGRYLAASVRQKERMDGTDLPALSFPTPPPDGFPRWSYRPPDGYYNPNTKESFGFSIADLCNELFPLIFRREDAEDVTGLVLIAGTTSGGKTQIANGLLWRYLQNQKRACHVVTIEDELAPFWKVQGSNHHSPGELADYGLFLTRRHRRTDLEKKDGLRRALMGDALRQKPKAVYVSEVRDDTDWRPLLEFAATGHLVIATSHAGSVGFALGRMFRAMDAESSEELRDVAKRVLGLVHVEHVPLDEKGGATVPALWRNSEDALRALASERHRSVLPYTPNRNPEAYGCLGRTYMGQALLKRVLGEEDAAYKDTSEAQLQSATGILAQPERQSPLPTTSPLREDEQLALTLLKKCIKMDLTGI